MKLIIGNKRYSSWSLRPWILMKHFQIPFEEVLIPLDQPETSANILKVSPSGKVPAFSDGELTIWESMAIAEYLNEKYPEKQMWPANSAARAYARSVANEMHGGFQTMRSNLPHDLKLELKKFDWTPARRDIERVIELWTGCLKEFGGPFLFGEFSIADAMYAPVVNRFKSYAVSANPICEDYQKRMRELPAHVEWIEGALKEELQMPRYDR